MVVVISGGSCYVIYLPEDGHPGFRALRADDDFGADATDVFVWDGCDACRGGGRIDLSVDGLQNVDSKACQLGVVPGVTWQVVDRTIKQFVA